MRERGRDSKKTKDRETASGRKCSEANVHSQAATAALSSFSSFSFSSISTLASRLSSSSYTKESFLLLSSALLHRRRRRRRRRRPPRRRCRRRRRLLVVDDHDDDYDDDGDVQQREQNVPTPPTPPPPRINLVSLPLSLFLFPCLSPNSYSLSPFRSLLHPLYRARHTLREDARAIRGTHTTLIVLVGSRTRDRYRNSTVSRVPPR